MSNRQPRVRQVDWDGDTVFLVWADDFAGDPAAMLAFAQECADDEDMVIITNLEEVRISTWRTSPCHPSSCFDGGGHRCHYDPATPGSRGSFRAARFFAAYKDDMAEWEEIERSYRWGVGSGDQPQMIHGYPSERAAQQTIDTLNRVSPTEGPHRLYTRTDADAPWRELVEVKSDLL